MTADQVWMWGQWIGAFLLMGGFPAPFFYVGATRSKRWATVTGWILASLGFLRCIATGGVDPGVIAGVLLSGWAMKRPSKSPPAPRGTSNS